MNQAGRETPPNSGAPVAVKAPWPKPWYAWYVVCLLMVGYAFAMLDRTIIALLVDPIKQDLGVTDAQMGLLQGFAFAIFFVLVGMPLGYLLDRQRRTPMIGVGVMAWSLATMACGLAKSFGSLFATRITVGAGEAVLIPGATSLIGDLFPLEKRGKAMGVFMAGASVGIAMAYALGALAIKAAEGLKASGFPGLADMHSWQIVFLLVGAPGVLVSLLIFLTVREPARRERQSVKPATVAAVAAHIRARWVAYSAILLGGSLNGVAVAAQLGWFATLFIREFHWAPAKVGGIFAAMTLPFGSLSAIASGWIMTWLVRRGRKDGPILVMIAQAIVWGVFGTAKSLASTAEWSLAFHVVTASVTNWSVVANAMAVNQITPNEMRGQLVAFQGLITSLVSYSLGAWVVGQMTDSVFHGPNGIGQSLGVVYSISGVGGLLLLVWGRKKFVEAVKSADWAD